MQSHDYDVQPVTVKDRIYEILRREIILGRLKPGETINIQHWGAKLNVSSAPLREALNMLSRDGLVTLPPRKHASVSEIDPDDMAITMQLRLLLEPYAAELSVPNIPQNELDAMRKKLNAVLEHPENLEAYIESDLELHEILYQYANSDIVKKTLTLIKEYSIRLRYYAEVYVEMDHLQTICSSTKEHLNILDAIEARDVALVKQLVCEHCKNGAYRNFTAAEGVS